MADDEKPTSIWKKEMSFRRKDADESAPEGPAESESGSGSIWKKELSLRKKAQDVPVEEVVAAEPEPPVNLTVEPVVELEPVAVAPVPTPEPTPVVEHSWLTKPLEEISDPPDEPVAAAPPVEAVAAVEPVADEPTLVSSPVSLVPAE
jgi:hypothetical protein